MFWNKKNNDRDTESHDLKHAVKERAGKSGFLKIYRMEKRGSARRKRLYVDQASLRKVSGAPVEDFLLSQYGGGDYILELYAKENGAEKYIDEFEFEIAGEPLTEDGEFGEKSEKNDKLSEFALKALEEKIKGGSGLNDILIARLIDKALDGDEQFGKSLRNLQTLNDIVKPNIPIVQPETAEGKLMDLLIGIVPAIITAKSARSLPPEAQQLLAQNPNLAKQISQYNPNLSQMPLPDQITGNGHKPNKTEAFEILFLEPFRASASQADENLMASMIDAMVVDSLLWLAPDEYPSILRDFILAYESGNIAQLASAFDLLMKFAGVPEEKANNIKKILLMTYQRQIKAKPDDSGSDKAKSTESEEVIANA